MFRIPLRIGKNNDIVDDLSEVDGTTDRGMLSRRSLDELAESTIFKQRNDSALGNEDDSYNYYNHRKLDIIDINIENNIPIELMGNTGV